MADQRYAVPAQRRRGFLFWLLTLLLGVLTVALAVVASPPVLVGGLVLAALVLVNPGRAGDGVRAWSAWRRIPFLGTRRTAAGFAIALLLYTVPVPGLVTYALVSGSQSNGTSQPSGGSAPAAPASSPTVGAAPAPESPSPSQSVAPSPPTRAAAPTPAATPIVVPAPPPPPPPASTCSASVKFPTPGDGGDETVYVTSNVPNATVTITAHYKTTNHTFTAATDAGGSAADTFSIGRPTIGYTVLVDVTVGSAHCSTSFTPQ